MGTDRTLVPDNGHAPPVRASGVAACMHAAAHLRDAVLAPGRKVLLDQRVIRRAGALLARGPAAYCRLPPPREGGHRPGRPLVLSDTYEPLQHLI